MIYFKLPLSPINIFQDIKIESHPNVSQVFISQSLCNYMNDIKSKISSREKEWDFYKKYTNPYEYIHTVVPLKKKSVSKYKPISRSYFKMMEMMAEFRLDHPAAEPIQFGETIPATSYSREQSGFRMENVGGRGHNNSECEDVSSRANGKFCQRTETDIVGEMKGFEFQRQKNKQTNPPIFFVDRMRTFHLAEGPGGFIEAICNKRDNPEDEYYGMTIILDENDDNVPAWHKTSNFLSQHPNVNLEYGIDGTGNLLHIDNFEHCVKKYGSSMDLITADGGFDFSKDFNRQEISITNLLWGQVCYALCLQKLGGNFVLKIFDIFYRQTVDILYILSAFYEEVNICKLKTSRVGNSEKYVVCKKFRFSSYLTFYPKIYESFLKIKSELRRDFAISDFLLRFGHVPSYLSAQMQMPITEEESSSSSSSRVHSVVGGSKGEMKNVIGANANAGIRSQMECEYNQPDPIHRLLNCDIPRHFTKTIEEINAIFGQQQIENIHYTISLIDKQPKQDKLEQLVKQNITKCINWCIEHSVIYNNLVATNVFGAKPRTDNICEGLRR